MSHTLTTVLITKKLKLESNTGRMLVHYKHQHFTVSMCFLVCNFNSFLSGRRPGIICEKVVLKNVSKCTGKHL